MSDNPDVVLLHEIVTTVYGRGRREAFAEAADLASIAGEMFSVGGMSDGERVAVEGAMNLLVAMLRRRADPDAKPPEVVGDD